MDPSSSQPVLLWPLAVYFGLVIVMVAGMLGISYVFGQKHTSRSTREPYESGIVATGSARVRFDVRFFQNALFFVVFDLETMFIIAWAIAARQAGWVGYIEVLVFIGVLLAALVYLWKTNALDWRTKREINPGYRGAGLAERMSKNSSPDDPAARGKAESTDQVFGR
jgi:NADH-quinone oxidoreductase subunit A